MDEIVFAKVDSLEGLSSIKHILYEENILYLLISVIGLLIALIGSAVFTRHSK
jgi:sensor histidine kinase regulating citrate/malate metabolism